MYRALAVTLLLFTSSLTSAQSDPGKDEPVTISPFGTKPIQLSIGKDGIKQNKEPGFVCELNAMNGQYSEWGESERDARDLVHKKCSKKSGLLLCSKKKIKCRQEQ